MAARPYAAELRELLRSTMARMEEPEHPLLAKRPEQRILVIVLTGERGLAGAFNSKLCAKRVEFMRSKHSGKKAEVIAGRQERPRCCAGLKVDRCWRIRECAGEGGFGAAREIAARVIELYTKRKIDAVYMVFSEFKTVMTQNMVVEKLLPVEEIAEDRRPRQARKMRRRSRLHLRAAGRTNCWSGLLPRYVETRISRMLPILPRRNMRRA